MKKALLFIIFIATCITSALAENTIEVVYLTANAYCPSVEQIAKETKTVLDSLYTKEKETGIITESTYNIMEEKNQDFIHKWEICTNGLILLVHRDDKCEKVDLNDFAFSNVPSDTPYFRKEFANKINVILSTFH